MSVQIRTSQTNKNMSDMTDMLVILRDLKPVESELLELENHHGITIRKPIAPEKSILVDWVNTRFGAGWSSEVEVACSSVPSKCFVAQKEGELLGFAVFDVSSRGFFGPTGVAEEYRGLGIGKILLVKSLEALKDMGFAYAIIGGVGPVEFYKKTVGAMVIEGSSRSIYANMLKRR